MPATAKKHTAHDLSRFLKAQADPKSGYLAARAELKRGRKRSCWMWYIFPRMTGAGLSATSAYYALGSADEARAYLAHPALGPRLEECAAAVLDELDYSSARQIFGAVDAGKLVLCALLFAAMSPRGSVFHRLIRRMAR